MASDHAQPHATRPPKGWFRSIRTRLIVVFSLSFAAILAIIEWIGFAGIPFTAYEGRKGYYKLEASRGLELIADLKEERLRWEIDERRNDLQVFARDQKRVSEVQSFLEAIRVLQGNGLEQGSLRSHLRQQPDYQALNSRLQQIKAAYRDYRRIFIIAAATGAIIVSTDEQDLGKDSRQEPFFREPLRSDSDYVSDLQLVRGRPALFFSCGMGRPEQKRAAVMVAEVNSEKMLMPILHTGEALGEHGEALLVNRDARIITTLKHPLPDGSRPGPLERQLATVPAERAARGEQGVIVTNDYRGVPVLAA